MVNERINSAWPVLDEGDTILSAAPVIHVLDVKRPEDSVDYEKDALRREVVQFLVAKNELLAAKEDVQALLPKRA